MDEPVRWYRLPEDDWERQVDLSDELVGRGEPDLNDQPERAVLMGIESDRSL